jgi:hypothetical protein
MPPLVAKENFVTTFEMPPLTCEREPDLFFEGMATWLLVELGFKGASGCAPSFAYAFDSSPALAAIVMLFWLRRGSGLPITDFDFLPDLSIVIGLLPFFWSPGAPYVPYPPAGSPSDGGKLESVTILVLDLF